VTGARKEAEGFRRHAAVADTWVGPAYSRGTVLAQDQRGTVGGAELGRAN
jgi:hypothetical protein